MATDINASPLPADLDTLPRSALVALCEERGIPAAPRETAESLRRSLRVANRLALADELSAAWRAAHPPVENEGKAIVRDALRRLTDDFDSMNREADLLLHGLDEALPALAAFIRGDQRVTSAAAAAALTGLIRRVDEVRADRAKANARRARR